jgi:Protein of unknown function (DUF4019)
MNAITLQLRHFMNRFLSPRGLALIVFLLLFFALSQPARAISPDDQSARETALRWLALIDSGHYRQAFEEWAPRLKAASMGADYFIKWMQTRRLPLGHARKRVFYKVWAYHNANGWPDGTYQQIDFKTSFERKALGWERVILTKETGHWQVGNYSFK